MANEWDGIAGFRGNDATSWTAKIADPTPLTLDSIRRAFEMEVERERLDNDRMREWGKRWEEFRKSDPRRYEATLSAMYEVFGRMGDPVNPIIAHPKQVERYRERLVELLEGRKS